MKRLSLFIAVPLLLVAQAFAAEQPAPVAPEVAKRDTLIKRVETCEAILQDFMARRDTAIPTAIFQKARAIAIVNQFKAGFIFGFKQGYGILMVKKPDNSWSLPVLITAGEASFGFQAGAESVETIYIMTDDATPKLFFRKNFRVGVDAKAVAGPKTAEVERADHPIVDAPILAYTKSAGLSAGATVKAGYLSRNDDANRLLYNTAYTMPELLYGNWVSPIPEVQPLMQYVKRLAP